MTPGNHSVCLTRVQSLALKGEGEEMMPRFSFWAPVTASRYLLLFDIIGDDNLFSSDLANEKLRTRLGQVGDTGRETGMHLLTAFSGRDE